MEQRYKFSIESKSFPLDISGEPIKYKWDEDRQALTFDNDGWYSSDFNSLAVL